MFQSNSKAEDAKPSNPLAEFKCADFDPSAWVNAHIDQRVSMLPRLQMLAQDINEKLERNMSIILSSLPRVSADCERIKADSQSLQPMLTTLEEKVVELSPQVGAQEPLEILGHLSTIKGNLELCCNTLFEAANWHRLVRQVESHFSTKNLSSVAARLGDMRKSLVLLKGMPDQDKRADRLERFEERLETLITPGLREALKHEEDLEPVKEYIKVFDELGRSAMLISEYTNSRCHKQVRELWTIASGSPMDQVATSLVVGDSIERWLPRFCDRLRAFLDREQKRAVAVFVHQDVSAEVSRELILTAVRVYHDALAAVLLQITSSSSSRSVDRLCSIYEIIQDTLAYLIDLLRGNDSTSVDSVISGESLNEVVRMVLSPFTVSFDAYPKVEAKWFTSELELEGNSNSNDDDDVEAQLFGALSRSDVLDLIDSVWDRAVRLAGGAHMGLVLTEISNVLCTHHRTVLDILQSSSLQQAWGAKSHEDQFQTSLRLLRAVGKYEGRFQNTSNSLYQRVYTYTHKTLTHANTNTATDVTDRVVKSELDRRPVLLECLQDMTRGGDDDDGVGATSLVTNVHVLHSAQTSLTELINSSQRSAFKTVLAQILTQLQRMPLIDVWTNPSGSSGTGGAPLTYMTTVGNLLTGEEVLSLSAHFDDHKDTWSAAFIANTHVLLSDSLARLESALSLTAGSLSGPPFLERFPADKDLLGQSWFATVVKGATLLFVEHALLIVDLCWGGLTQLDVDAEYLENVTSSLLGAAGADPLLLALRQGIAHVKQEIHSPSDNLNASLKQQVKGQVKHIISQKADDDDNDNENENDDGEINNAPTTTVTDQ